MKSEEQRFGSQKPGEGPGSRAVLWRPILLVSFLAAVIIFARFLEIGQYLGSLRAWIAEMGTWGPMVFALVYVVAVVMAVPGSALTVVAGALFGSVVGILLVSLAATLGASLSFLVARYFAREAVETWLSGKQAFRKLDQLAEKNGAVIVALTRLVPIFPFNLLNYGFGLTKIPFWTYVFWSWLCMLPGTIVYVVGTDAVINAISQGKVPWAPFLVLLATVLVLVILVRFARVKLQDKEEET